MRRVVLHVGVALALSLGLVALTVSADDTKPTKSSDRPDWSGYVYVTDVVGEVVRADDKTLKLRVTWYQPQVKNGGNNRNTRPNLYRNNRNYRNPYAPNRNRPNQPRVTFKEQHHDYDIDFLPQSLVRTKILPPKLDDNGKKVSHTQKELDELRKPSGVTGYASSVSDLTPGTIVEVILIRDKTIPSAKVTEDDVRIKYAIIWGHDPNPPKDITKGGNKNNKNNKKKN